MQKSQAAGLIDFVQPYWSNEAPHDNFHAGIAFIIEYMKNSSN